MIALKLVYIVRRVVHIYGILFSHFNRTWMLTYTSSTTLV